MNQSITQRPPPQVNLSAPGRQFQYKVRQSLATGKAAARKLIHARILLKADASDDGLHWADWRIADALEIGIDTVERVRQRFVEQGFDAALERKNGANRPGPSRWMGGSKLA